MQKSDFAIHLSAVYYLHFKFINRIRLAVWIASEIIFTCYSLGWVNESTFWFKRIIFFLNFGEHAPLIFLLSFQIIINLNLRFTLSLFHFFSYNFFILLLINKKRKNLKTEFSLKASLSSFYCDSYSNFYFIITLIKSDEINCNDK